MKCVKIKDKKKLELTTTNEPIADNNHVIIKVSKCGICGSDLHNFELGNPVGLIMGHEFSGTVIDPGNRTDLKVGDRVTALPLSPCLNCEACLNGNIHYCKETWTHAVGLSLDYPGALSQKIKLRSDMVIKLDDNITDEEAAMVEPTAVGLHAVNLADIEIGDKVLIIGGGIIGLISAMFAKLAGASSITLLETNKNRANKASATNEFFWVISSVQLKALDFASFIAKEFGFALKLKRPLGFSPAVALFLLFTLLFSGHTPVLFS